MPQGFFITFEGLDGSGKSTQALRLRQSLEAAGHTVTVTRQPGGTVMGDAIRELLLDSRTRGVAPMAELALMFADRAQSIAEVIRPALSRGEIVICDRFTDSTEAYQGGGRRLGSQAVIELNAILCGSLTPDLTILLLPNRNDALGRARSRNRRDAATAGINESRFESEDDVFYRRVEEKYLEIAERESSRIAVIPGNDTIDAIHARVAALVDDRLAAASIQPIQASGLYGPPQR